MTINMEVPSLLVAMAVFSWCLRRVKLPQWWEVVGTVGAFRVSKEDLKSLGKRLEALKLPISPELFFAGRLAITVLSLLLGLLLVLGGHREGMLFLLVMPLLKRLPDWVLKALEKKRKEELLKDFPLMLDQIKIYAKAAGYYHALKVVAKSFKGVLGRELAVLSAEMELVGLVQALNHFADRCGIPEFKDFARVMMVEETTGADISTSLSNYSTMVRQKQVSKVKRKIKLQPILMSVLPGILLVIFMMMLIIPMVTNIVQQISSIR